MHSVSFVVVVVVVIFVKIPPFIPSHSVLPSNITTVGGRRGKSLWSTNLAIRVDSKIGFVNNGIDRFFAIKTEQKELKETVNPHVGLIERTEGEKTLLTCQSA